ncbi:MAG TPA: cytochrome P450, partial [Candidatus Binataceae bacterium]|nr:cytochrome P450 [Candidatus Binataceae bacterium]
MTAESTPIFFNPWDPEFRANPYPHYGPLLAGPPRILDLMQKVALIARFADVTQVLKDTARFSADRARTVPPEMRDRRDEGPFKGAPTMLTSDPPVHTRLRRLVSRDFTPKRIREMEPRIREIAAELINRVQRKGELEVMTDLANVLPVMVIAEMLGVPPERYETFKHQSDVVVSADNAMPGSPPTPEFYDCVASLRNYFSEEIEKRRKMPGSDLISALVAHQEAETLDAEELLAFVVLLLLAGNETTTNLIGNGMLALGRHPEQMETLRKSPELMPRAIEEILRYDGPVQGTFRGAVETVNVGGTEIPADTGCFALLAAANRDPAQFENPNQFDVTREPKDHVAFGEGIHFCIGAPLARLEGTIAIGEVLRRFPKIRLKEAQPKLTYKG